MTIKNFIEPGAIIVLFAVGTLVNSRRRRSTRSAHDAGRASSICRTRASYEYPSPRLWPDDSVFHSNPTSQILGAYPFLIEILYWNLTYWPYQLARAYSAYMIRQDDSAISIARVHALQLLSLEEQWSINFELRLQSYILRNSPYAMAILAKVYYSHIVVGVAFVVYCFTVLPPALFQRIRRTIAINNWIAFIIITCWRCMPPRLLPPEYGFKDILHSRPQSAWTHNRFQLTIAAMPSLHFGTALFIGICLSYFSPHRWMRWLSPLWPLLMLVTIIATANHFVLDAAIGAMVPALGWTVNEAVLLLGPLERWVFWLCRTERPTLDEEAEPSSSRTKRGDWMA